jgi:hypothetical protein
MSGDSWAWALADLDRGDFPKPQKVASQINAQTDFGAREVILPPEIAVYVAGLIDRTLKRKVGRKKKVQVIRSRLPDIILIEEVGGMEKTLGTVDAALQTIAERDQVQFATIHRRYYRARARELERIPDRDKP